MYYISRVSLRNIKCLPEEVTFSISAPSTGRPSWTLLLGDNGTGKTSILRCIAISLCDEIAAPALLAELSGSMIRTGQNRAEIKLELASTLKNLTDITIQTTIQKKNSSGETIKLAVTPSHVDIRNTLFACGYGCSYGTIGNESYHIYQLMDAVYTLFNYDTRLQNPELSLFRICEQMRRQFSQQYETLRGSLFNQIEAVLMLNPGSLKLDEKGLRVSGFWGESVPVRAIGDGYAATLTWVCDMLSWALLAQQQNDSFQPSGIVLLDEIEKHLHPAWQREIIDLLSQSFPKVQFIATTHAPLISTGAAALPEGCCRLVRLVKSDRGVQVNSELKPPSGLRADQVLTSELFGLLSTTSSDTVWKIERYAALSAKPELTEFERQEVDDLGTDLHHTFGTPETRLQQKVEKAITNAFKELAPVGEFDESAMTLEMRRQLGTLFRLGGTEHD